MSFEMRSDGCQFAERSKNAAAPPLANMACKEYFEDLDCYESKNYSGFCFLIACSRDLVRLFAKEDPGC